MLYTRQIILFTIPSICFLSPSCFLTSQKQFLKKFWLLDFRGHKSIQQQKYEIEKIV